MPEISSFERKLLSALKKDGRATVTTLAGLLGVSRATVQSSMERLVANGVIKRFTIDLDVAGEHDQIRAVTMIELQGNLARTVIALLNKMPAIVSLHTTNGAWDLVAQIETANLREFDRVLGDVRAIAGVLNSETCLLLNRA